jgi:hypothetical protein
MLCRHVARPRDDGGHCAGCVLCERSRRTNLKCDAPRPCRCCTGTETPAPGGGAVCSIAHALLLGRRSNGREHRRRSRRRRGTLASVSGGGARRSSDVLVQELRRCGGCDEISLPFKHWQCVRQGGGASSGGTGRPGAGSRESLIGPASQLRACAERHRSDDRARAVPAGASCA